MLLPNHAPELVNYLLPPHLKQACPVRGLEDMCSSQHCLHKAIWLARPAEDIAEELLGNLPILSFFVNQHVLQLPPSPCQRWILCTMNTTAAIQFSGVFQEIPDNTLEVIAGGCRGQQTQELGLLKLVYGQLHKDKSES